jgi:uncharacterized protein YceK
MKSIILLLAVAVLLGGCASTQFATDMGVKIGNSFTKAAAKGQVTAKESIKAWPYISGLIKGVLADNYRLEVNTMAQNIIGDLDKLAKKDPESLTGTEQGQIIGSYVRLEAIAVEEAWDSKYGVDLLSMVKSFVGL